MFYSQVILARKGPLGKIWLAAHYDKKLSKSQIYSTDISDSVNNVINPAAPLALRVSGHLMLGIVRIYSRKVKYMMSDISEIMWKMKLAFRPGSVDLPEETGQTVDDSRYFGGIFQDPEFPELQDIGVSVESKRREEVPRKYDIPEIEEVWSRPVTSLSGRVSEIELARREQMRLSSSLLTRSSISTLQKPMDTTIRQIEEEIPAFEEHDELLLSTGSWQPTLEKPDIMVIEEPLPVFEQELPPSLPEVVVEEAKESKEKKRRKVRKASVELDERVELSSKLIKGLMEDRSSLLRRLPTAPLNHQLIRETHYDMGPSFTGFCHDLMDTVNMTMSLTSLPFQSKVSQISKPERIEVARKEPTHEEPLPIQELFEEPPPESHEIFLEPEYEFQKVTSAVFPDVSEVEIREETMPTFDAVDKEHWNRRTKQVLGILEESFKSRDQSASFEKLTAGVSRRSAALCFFEILQLKTWNYIEVTQEIPFSTINIYPDELTYNRD